MPLLGKLVFNERGPTSNPHGVEEAFRIPHTKEVFTSREEYEERLQLYSRKVWTCQCTGHINLTHEEAFESERKCRENLSRTFPVIYEKPVLSIAHHSSDVLDKIVNSAYKLVHSQLFEGQKVDFGISYGKKFDAQIISISKNKQEPVNADGEGSPSSDKENHSAKQTLITDMFKTDKETKSAPSTQDQGQKSEVTELKYDIVLLTKNKIVRGVPSQAVSPVCRPPNRHNIRLFIRANAMRHDFRKQSAWIVDENMVQKYDLQGRFTDEEVENFLRASSNHSKSFVGYTPHSTGSNGLPHCNGTTLQTDQKTLKSDQTTKPILIVNLPDSSSSDSPSEKGRPIKLAPIFSPRSKKKNSPDIAAAISMIDFEFLEKVPTKMLEPKKKPKDSVKSESRKRKRNSKPTSTTPRKKKKIIDGGTLSSDDSPSKANKSKSVPKSPGSSRKSASPKKKKQATLLELTRKKGGMMLMTSKKSHTLGSSPSISPVKKPRAPRQPPIVYQLIRLKKDKKIHKYKCLVKDAAKMLNEKQRKNLPQSVKQDIMVKWEIFERKRKWDSLTPEERKKARAQKRVTTMQRYEDSDLAGSGKAKSLPTLEIAPIPGGLPNSVFGDIAMLVEFFHWHRIALGQKDNFRVTHASLAEALSAGKEGYQTISKVLMMIFHMLLSDNVAADYKEIDFAIDRVPIEPVVCSELARICLRQLDDDFDEDVQNKTEDQMEEEESGLERSAGVREEVFSKLLENEIYELEAEEQLEILCALVYRLINTYTAQGFREESRDKASELHKKICKMRMQDSLMKKEQKLQELESKEKEENSPTKKKENPEATKEESADLISRVKRRRIEALERKHLAEEEKMKREEEQRKLFEQQMREAEYEKLDKQLKEANVTAARALRLDALGSDRHHNRYWLFCDSTPGLYIEKGWVQDYIHYSTYVETKNDSALSASDDDLPLSVTAAAAGKKPSSTESTFPHVGQNLWFVIDSQEKLDETLSCFFDKGIRESQLKSKIEKKYNHIVKSIDKYQSLISKVSEGTEQSGKTASPPVTRNSAVKDPEEAARKSLKKQLMVMVNVMRGLESLQDEYEVLIARVESAEDVADFGSLLVDIFNAIEMRFFCDYMCPRKGHSMAAKVEKRRQRWVEAVESASTLSRMSFLLFILHCSVKWDMFRFCKTSKRRTSARNKNYAEMLQQAEEPEEQQVSSRRRTTRTRNRNSDNVDQGDLQAPSKRYETRSRSSHLASTRQLRSRQSIPLADPKCEDWDEDSGKESEAESASEESSEEESEEPEEGDTDKKNLERCLTLIKKISGLKSTALFRDPVDEEDVPDYYEIISNPISLSEIQSTIEKSYIHNIGPIPTSSKTRSSHRSREQVPIYTPHDLLKSVQLILDNAEIYNGQDSYVWRQAEKMKNRFIFGFREHFGHIESVMTELKTFQNSD